MRYILALLCTLVTSLSLADGYQQWKFGMTRDEVKAITQHGPYYSFQNGDLGSQSGPLDDELVPISFYFTDDTLRRVMLILYQGEDKTLASAAWQKATTHLQDNFGGLEVGSKLGVPGTVEQAAMMLDILLDDMPVGQPLQAGALPMPSAITVWTTFNRVQDNLYMVVVNYASR